jgi:hypothetical protein
LLLAPLFFFASESNWNQADEPWFSVQIPTEQPDTQVIYHQQAAHPWLAEYNRNISLVNNRDTAWLQMSINPGGKTRIQVYRINNNGKDVLWLTDPWGGYYIDLDKKELLEYAEVPQLINLNDTIRLGYIDGSSMPLRFVIDSLQNR